MVVKLNTERERKRPPAQKPPPIIDDDELENAAFISLEERERQNYLRDYDLWQDKRGLSIIRYRREQQVCIPIFRGTLEALARRVVLDVPTRLEKAPQAEDMLFMFRAGSPDGTLSQELMVSRADSLSRQPEYTGRLYVAPLPHARNLADLAHAFDVLSHFRTVPAEYRYSASGLLRLDEKLYFLNPAGSALTASGLDTGKRVQYPASLADALETVPYGWERTSTKAEAAEDVKTLLQVLDIAPGAPGYGALLVGIAGFSPLSQVCSTGGVHAIVHGPSGSQKSSTARLVQQGYAATWGREELSAVNLREGASTAYSIEQLAHHLAGMFVLLDDGLKGSKIGEKDVAAFYKMVSRYGTFAQARQGRSAGVWNQGKGGAAKSFYPRCSSVFTVEALPQSSKHTSELARFAAITLDGQECVNMALLDALQKIGPARAMNRAIASIIQWVLPRLDSYLAGIEAREATYRTEGAHPRTVPTYAKLETGLCIVLDYAASVGALSPAEADALLTRGREALKAACIAQQKLIGRGDAHQKSNDAIRQFFFYLAKAGRDGKLYASDAEMIDTKLTDGKTEKRHQPPTCLETMGQSKEEWGWRYREDMTSGTGQFFPASGAYHAGVLRQRGTAPAELKTLQRTFRDTVYPLLERMATADDALLPDYSDMLDRLKTAKKLSGPTSTVWLHGHSGERGRCFILQVPDDEKPDQGPGPEVPEDTSLFVCSLCGEQREDMYIIPDGTPDGKPVCFDCKPPDGPEDGPRGPDDGPGDAHQEQEAPAPSPAAEASEGTEATAGAEAPEASEGADGAEASSVPTDQEQEAQRPRVSFPSRQRKAAYLDVGTGRGVLETGARLIGAPGAGLARIVRALPADVTRVYLCGERPGETLPGMQEWADAGEIALAPDWQQQKRGHHFPLRDSGTLEDEPVLRFQHQETGRKLELRRMAAWLAEEEYTPEEAQAMHAALWPLLQETFDSRAFLMGTPKQTGLELWGNHQYGIAHFADFPPLPEDTQALIRSTSGQGRIELCPPEAATLPALYYLDGVFMYSALTNGLGSGPVTAHDSLNEYAGYTPGRYRIRFTVPEDWRHVGLFMVQAPDGEGWEKPCTPGYTGETWVDGAELHAAYQAQERTGADWHITILERLLLTAPAKGGHGPLYAWAHKLIGLRESLPGRVASGQLDARTGELVKSGIRAIVLHSIGGFHATAHDVTRRSLDASQVPTDVPTVRKRGQFWVWQEREKLTDPRFQHPEWSAAIWGRCRSRLLLHREKIGQEYSWSGALTLPRESIIGFWTDAIMTSTLPAWADGTRAGQFKVKGYLDGKVKTPRTDAAIQRVRERMKTEGGK